MKKESFSQPDFYHFSDDSVFLVKQTIIDLKKGNHIVSTVLDVCAGSGIVGLEFLQRYEHNKLKMTFIEKQREFKKHLESNIEYFGTESSQLKVIIKNLELSDYNGNELILCNPPYFIKGRGRLPQNLNKLECRFASPDFFRFLGEFFHYSSQGGARVYFLLPWNSEALNLIKEKAPGRFTLVSKKSEIGVFSYKGKS